MRLQITGGKKLHHKHCRQFTRFFASRFFNKQLSKQISVKVNLITRPSLGVNDGCAEMCWVDNPRRARKFHIDILITPTASLHYIISTLAHEMVHVKQYAKNQLIDLESTDYIVSIYNKKKYNTSRVPYFEQPWEIEAYGRTPGLTRDYFDTVKLTRKVIPHPVDY